MLSKRDFLKTAGASLAVIGAGAAPMMAMASVGDDVTMPGPITHEERKQRVAKAQRLMVENGMAAILLEPGPSMEYFTGMSWWRSERLTAVIIPREGELAVVTPAFEEATIRELMEFESEIRVWNEHESPFLRVAQLLDDRGLQGDLGLERSVRYFVVNGLQKEMSSRDIVSASPVVDGCRVIKSDHEIALMQAANDITLKAYREIYPKIETGMVGSDISAMMRAATQKFGGAPTFALAQISEASAYPHGTKRVFEVREGEVILMDCGCDYHGYKSDISRTWVHGSANAEQKRVWNLVREGQVLALETAKIGTPARRVDEVVRSFYAENGFGPDYQLPGLSHRLGHGIGMEGHEPINFVGNEETKLAPGMCLSNEPGIYIPGKFGVRHEDCLYMTESGPKLFTGLTTSIDNPMG